MSLIIHPQEKIVEDFDFCGVKIELVEWTDTVWCGKIGYAEDNEGEPEVEKIMNAYRAADHGAVIGAEKDWSACLSLNYHTAGRPNGLMVCDLVESAAQPSGFDVLKVPAGRYMRLRICDEAASALGYEPWHGGIPPFSWIEDRIAPALGYGYGSEELPVIEYYGFFNPNTFEHEYRYLYVPVANRAGVVLTGG